MTVRSYLCTTPSSGTLSVTLNVDIDDHRWTQASLPVRWGGLGVRGITLPAPSAYLASAASTMELTPALLPMRLRRIEESGIASAMSTWTRLATSSKDLASTPPPTSQLQRVWDDQCCKIQAGTLLDDATDQSSELVFLLHALRNLAIGSMHYPYPAQD